MSRCPLRGVTLLEMLVVLALLTTLVMVLAPPTIHWRNTLLTQRAAREVSSFYSRSRMAAVFLSHRVRIEFDADSLVAIREGIADSTLFVAPGPSRHGVELTATRAAVRIAPTGVGWGAANTKVILRRAAAAESLTTSRLGRLRHWP